MGEESSFDVLKTYLEARASFTREEVAFDSDEVPPSHPAQRGIPPARWGSCQVHGFVASGCMRKYAIDAAGKEHIVSFAPETWWVADGVSLRRERPRSSSSTPLRIPIFFLSIPRPTSGLSKAFRDTPPRTAWGCRGLQPQEIGGSFVP